MPDLRLVDVIIALHDPARPIERAAASVLADGVDGVRVIVVCHGIPAEPIRARLAAHDEAVEVIEHVDGIRSAAGPFNRGLEEADAAYVAVMGSDDFLEPGAMRAWTRCVRDEHPDAVLAPIREQGGAVLLNPLARVGRTRHLDPVKDRMFYRTAPLGLLRRERVEQLGLRFEPGVRVSEDLAFGVRLWAEGGRVDFPRTAPAYVVGKDAAERTTLAPMAVEDELEAHRRLLEDSDVLTGYTEAVRRSFATKLIRISVLGVAQRRPTASDWRGDDEVAFLARILADAVRLAPRILEPFSRQERIVLDGLLREPTVGRVTADVQRSRGAGRFDRVVTSNPLLAFSRESVLRRYALYAMLRASRGGRS